VAAQGFPAAEVDLTAPLVRRLLAEQHPDLAEHPLTLVANGWDNVIFRLGDDLVVRLPRRQLAAELVLNEQRVLPGLAQRLPLAIPTPVRLGRPSDGYPWHWSVCRWFDGSVAADVPLGDPAREAERLGAFLAALHEVAPPEAPVNPYRGHPIAELHDRFIDRVGQLEATVPTRQMLDRWHGLADVGEWEQPAVWLHGDLHSANVIVDDGSLVAVVDWGDVTSGDPACDFAIGWMLFDVDERQVFRQSAGRVTPVGDATWQRAEAWALHFAVMYLVHSADSEQFDRMGTTLLARLLPS